MKKHHLILLSTAAFVTLFYEQTPGLNLGILGLIYVLLTLANTKAQNRTVTFYFLKAAGLSSSLAFAWYGDFPSLLALVFSLLLLTFKAKNRRIKPLLAVPVFILNGFTFMGRALKFDNWLPKTDASASVKKLIAMVFAPSLFLIMFFTVYAMGSDSFAELFEGYEIDLNAWEIVLLACLGFFLAFNYFHFSVPRWLYKKNSLLNDQFSSDQKHLKPTYSFLDLDLERKSGVVTLTLLNILLLCFISAYNYEQFFQAPSLPKQLSADVHEQVNAVILSIVMAIVVIMFYFKSAFNFDEKAGNLKTLAKIWLTLNAVLVSSALIKNTEYVGELGLTYKRLGVYAFLILCMVGLVYSYAKIAWCRTNAYLFNRMFWYFYGTVLAMSLVNWGAITTIYNIRYNKMDMNHLFSLNFNEHILLKSFPEEAASAAIVWEIATEKELPFLSKRLYYHFINQNIEHEKNTSDTPADSNVLQQKK